MERKLVDSFFLDNQLSHILSKKSPGSSHILVQKWIRTQDTHKKTSFNANNQSWESETASKGKYQSNTKTKDKPENHKEQNRNTGNAQDQWTNTAEPTKSEGAAQASTETMLSTGWSAGGETQGTGRC